MSLYMKGKKVTVRPSFCLFIDALGFKNEILINDSIAGKKANKHLRNFYSAFKGALTHLDDEDGKVWGTKIFTDNIVLGSPIDKWVGGTEEGVFGSIIIGVMWFQLMMIYKGFFFRGGWSIGNLFMDDKVVYGKALIDAYEIESKIAKYPRILLSQEMKELVNHHMSFYFDQDYCPQLKHILMDEEGNYFINYLFSPLEYAGSFSDIEDILKKHKEHIEQNLKIHKEPEILKKYRWVAFYHDYFCTTFLNQCPQKYFINAAREEKWQIRKLPWMKRNV